MKFFSIKEYFYKLNTIGFILLLVPLLAFIFLYFQSVYQEALPPEFQSTQSLIIGFAIIFIVHLTIVHWLWISKRNRLKNLIELAKKMDGYFSFSVLRMSTHCVFSLVAAFGFFLSGNSLFTGVFMCVMIVSIFQWPSPSSFCRQLDLRGSERDMVLNNRDLYQQKKRT